MSRKRAQWSCDRGVRNPVGWSHLNTSEKIIYVVLCLVELGGNRNPRPGSASRLLRGYVASSAAVFE